MTIVATGSMVHPSLQAQAALAGEGRHVCVLDMHTIKPLDREAVQRAASTSELIVTVEEHNIVGGLGGAVAEVMAESASRARLIRHGIHDDYSLIGPPSHLYRHYGLDAEGIADVVRRAVVQPGRSDA